MRKCGVKFVLILLCGLLLGVGCKEDGTTLYEIPLHEKLGSAPVADVNHFAGSIDYVPLETTDSCLIGEIYKILCWKDYYYISDFSGNLYLFTKEGKFVRKIGVQGRGPQEYVILTNFIVDPEKGDIFLIDYGKVLVYNIEGEVKRTFPVSSDLQVCAADRAGHLIFISPVSAEKDSFNLLIIYDKEGQIIRKIPAKSEPCDLNYFNWITEQDGQVYYKPEFSDTLYFLDTALKIHPYALVCFGRYELQPALLNMSKMDEWQKYYRLDGVFDFKHLLVLNVQKGLMGKDLESYVFDKKKGKIEKWCLGGEKLIVKSASENQLVCSLTALEILEHKGEQSARLEEVISRINADSNPVLVVVNLKE